MSIWFLESSWIWVAGGATAVAAFPTGSASSKSNLRLLAMGCSCEWTVAASSYVSLVQLIWLSMVGSSTQHTDWISIGMKDFFWLRRTSFWCSVSGCLNWCFLRSADLSSWLMALRRCALSGLLDFVLPISMKSLSGIWSISAVRSSLRLLWLFLRDLGEERTEAVEASGVRIKLLPSLDVEEEIPAKAVRHYWGSVLIRESVLKMRWMKVRQCCGFSVIYLATWCCQINNIIAVERMFSISGLIFSLKRRKLDYVLLYRSVFFKIEWRLLTWVKKMNL